MTYNTSNTSNTYNTSNIYELHKLNNNKYKSMSTMELILHNQESFANSIEDLLKQNKILKKRILQLEYPKPNVMSNVFYYMIPWCICGIILYY